MWTNFNDSFTVVFADELQKMVVLDLPPHLKSLTGAVPCNKKAQLTPGLRATAPSFQDGASSKMAVSHHLGYY